MLGVLQLLGAGFGFGILTRLSGKVRGESTGATFALGAVYGFAGFCSGPILGAVLTVAAASGQTLRGATLLAIYALGMAVPLFLMAALWDRLDLGRRPFLRGRELSVGRLRLHTTNLFSGAMFILLGTVFIAYEGTSALSGLYEAYGAVDLAFATEGWAGSFARSVPDALVLAVTLVAALTLALLATDVAGASHATLKSPEKSGQARRITETETSAPDIRIGMREAEPLVSLHLQHEAHNVSFW